MNAQEIIKTEQVLGKVLHVYGTPEEPLFVAKNVADWIGHSDTSMMVSTLDNDEKGTSTVCTPGGNQRLLTVTEFGLYEILMMSRKPVAKAFKKEVKRIIRELRIHGVTATRPKIEEMMLNPDEAIKVFERLKSAYAATELAEKRLALQQPKVAYYDEVLQSEELMPITVIAKELGRSAINLNQELHDRGIIFSVDNTWVLYAEYQDKGYAYHKVHKSRRGEIFRHLCWTEKGCEFIHGIIRANK